MKKIHLPSFNGIGSIWYYRNYFCKLRNSNIQFPIETRRWIGIPMDDKLCNLCNRRIGNEFHYIFCCELLKDIRTKYMQHYFISCPCKAKMNSMLKIGNTQVLAPLSLFLQKIAKPLLFLMYTFQTFPLFRIAFIRNPL